jgi:hypothetical protein
MRRYFKPLPHGRVPVLFFLSFNNLFQITLDVVELVWKVGYFDRGSNYNVFFPGANARRPSTLWLEQPAIGAFVLVCCPACFDVWQPQVPYEAPADWHALGRPG